jgi:hypothetical protein
LDRKTWSIDVVPIDGPDALREVTRGSDAVCQAVELRVVRRSEMEMGWIADNS